MQKLPLIPAFISSLRIATLPLFLYLYNIQNVAACLGLLAFCAASDYFDGYFARRLNATSRFGAYYDATTDFSLVIGAFALFAIKGFYPIWLPLLIAASFAQFLITSHYVKKVYDPVGKYIGSALCIGIVLTLVFPEQSTYSFVQLAFVGFFLISLGSRVISLARSHH